MSIYRKDKSFVIRFAPYNSGGVLYTNGNRHVYRRYGSGQKPYTGVPLYCDTLDVGYTDSTSMNSHGNPDCDSSLWPSTYRYVNSPETFPGLAACLTKARSRLFDQINTGGAELLTAAAEFGDTLGLITMRFNNLRNIVGGLRKADIRRIKAGFAVRPKTPPKQGARGLAKDAGAAWLEWWFAIAPTISDVQVSLDTLSKDFPENRYTGSATASTKFTNQNSSWHLARESGNAKLKIKIGTTVRVTNPNLYLASQLGLVNPLQTAWDTTPFSWLLGWVVNISEFLGSFTETLGLTLSNTYYTRFVKTDAQVLWIVKPSLWDPSTWDFFEGTVEGARMVREVGYIPAPKIHVSVPRLSVTRALTSCSLLVQGLREPKFGQ